MSRNQKPVSAQKNTLFKYFSSPKTPTTLKNSETSSPCLVKEAKSSPGSTTSGCGTPSIHKNKETKLDIKNDDSGDELQITKSIKRRRIALLDSDSEPENESPNKKKSPKEKNPPAKRHRIQPQSSDCESEEEIPIPPKKKMQESDVAENSEHKSFVGSFSYSTREEKSEIEFGNNSKTGKVKTKPVAETNIDSGWLHNTLDFLKPEKIRDAEKRRPSEPDYDSRTLHVPESYLNSLTPAMRQWWILKSQHMDSVLFFKVGKFYELYHMDAVIGVQQLGFSYMKGDFAHSGFPEGGYSKMATMLIDKGFRVARVEQTETPEMMAERCKTMKKTTKFDKVVSREICQVTTKASCVYGAQMPEARSEMGNYLCAIAVKANPDNTSRLGICFTETSIGTFYLSEFDDDKHCSKLLTLFAEYPPYLILIERGVNYGHLKYLLNTQLKDIKQEVLAAKTQFYEAATTLETLFSACYFKTKDGKFEWPKLFEDVAEDCNPKSEYELALKSLGAIHWFLKRSFLDIQLFSMGLFEKYEPVDSQAVPLNKHIERDYMVLDSTALQSLSLLGGQGTLQKTIDFCKTPFGKRLLPQFICRPLCNLDKIKLRQGAVKELNENPQKLQSCQEILKKLPDLERQVAKIHTYGNKFCVTSHPDGRAILYETKTYSKRKILDLLNTLRGFEASQEINIIFKDCESRLLRKLTQFEPTGMNIDLTETLTFFKQAFNHEAAEKEGKIIPKRGVEHDFDEAEDQIEEINEQLKQYLKQQSTFFGCQVSYFGTDKKRFQLEVPEHRASKADGKYQLEGHKKGAKPAKRFSTPRSRELLQDMLKAEAERNKIILDLNRRIFEKFSLEYNKWQQVIHCLALLDVICSLAEYASTFSGDICLPNIHGFSTKPFISIDNGKNPCVMNIETFVPNDTYMGAKDKAPLLLLTGPNMGGKSTLMRQVSVICIMAQMGSFVPASQCSFSMVDRVFTRLGACDDIVRGHSTFFVELSEASAILRHASKQSLLIIDELGRGTSTHDGNAIATAYLKRLTQTACRTLFSTHYHSLVDQFVNNAQVQLGHMACMVENEDDESEESVTLLYKLSEGRCPKSFGFNAAKLAGLSAKVVARAREISKQIEIEDKCRNVFRKVFASDELGVDEVIAMVRTLEV
ncbi:probable DNA mismatch repair protein Msh6 [Euwallacea fornicatus]|uniref:probable DNA mismatch repair protein Msh6 n=1 Tax=Euwallacea fornicatus TaxID=995702 RepID=UPI00338D9024